MADLTSTDVTIDANRSWELGDRFNKLIGKKLSVTLVLTAQGDGAAGSNIPASALGLTTVFEVRPLTKSDDSLVVVGAPNYAKSGILLKAAATNAPAQYTGTFKTVVIGY